MQAVLLVGNDKTASRGGRDEWVAALRVGGLTLLSRAARAAQRAGVERILVLGPDDPGLRGELERDQHLPIPVQWEVSSRPLAEATTMLRGAKHLLDEHFWVVAVDRVVSPALFPSGCAESTWSPVVDGGTDVGVYAATRDVVARCEAPGPLSSVTRPDDTPIAVDGALWHSVTRAADLRPAQARITKSLRKPFGRNADGLAAYFINRPISLRISRIVVNTPTTPNMVTTFALLVGLMGAVFASTPSYWSILIGAVLLQVSSIVDGVDGELARMRMTSSHSGEWYDTVCDDVINISFMVALGVANYGFTGDQIYLTLAAIGAATAVTMTGFFYRELIKEGLASHNNFEWGFESEDTKGIIGLLRPVLIGFSYIAKRDTYTVLLCVLLALGLTQVAFLIMFAGSMLIATGYFGPKLLGLLAGKRDESVQHGS